MKEVWVLGSQNPVPGKSDNATFLLTDNEIKSETFLEYINSFLNTGLCTGLLEDPDKASAGEEAQKFYKLDEEVKPDIAFN
jgi:hypothetical protein